MSTSNRLADAPPTAGWGGPCAGACAPAAAGGGGRRRVVGRGEKAALQLMRKKEQTPQAPSSRAARRHERKRARRRCCRRCVAPREGRPAPRCVEFWAALSRRGCTYSSLSGDKQQRHQSACNSRLLQYLGLSIASRLRARRARQLLCRRRAPQYLQDCNIIRFNFNN